MLHRRLDVPDKNLAVIMAARNLVQLLPVDDRTVLFLDIGQGLGILHDFPGMGGHAMLLEFEFARTADDPLQLVQRPEIFMNPHRIVLLILHRIICK
ncbi:hypothetical protein D3C73_1417640 [compost metagenome]